MRYVFYLFLAAIFTGCNAGRLGRTAITFVPFADMVANPTLFEGKTIETQCLMVDDGFETKWLLHSLRILEEPPIAYSFSRLGNHDNTGLALLRIAKAERRVVSVTIQGRLAVHPKAFGAWRVEFVIDKIISAKSEPKPNQEKEPTASIFTPAADALVTPAIGAAEAERPAKNP